MTSPRRFQRQVLGTTEFHWVKRVLQARARAAVARAVKAGILKQPDECENCRRPKKLNGHHFAGYEEQHHLDVVWLCQPCHVWAHHPNLPNPDSEKAWEDRLDKPTALTVLQSRTSQESVVR